MKKGLQIMALIVIVTFLLMGTAIARPFGETMAPWNTLGSDISGDTAYGSDTLLSKANQVGLSRSQGLIPWLVAHRFTRIQQMVTLAGYQANLTVSILSMPQSVRTIGLAPTVTLEFVW